MTSRPVSAPRLGQWWLLAAFAGLAALNAMVYGRVLAFDLVRWDDDLNITHNPLLTRPVSWGLLADSFSADQALRFRPVHFWLSRAVYAVFGFEPAAWHALNLALHAGAAWLVFHVLGRTIALAVPRAPAAVATAVAWAGAAGWAVHPLRAEPVAWATASTYACATLWLLGSFACYLESGGAGRRRVGWLVAAWVLAVASYASYPIGLTYALFLAVFERWRAAEEGRSESLFDWRAWVVPAAFLAPAVAAAGATLWSRYANPGVFVSAPTLTEVGLSTRAIVPLASLTFLAGKFFWPGELTPNVPPLAVQEELGRILLLAGVALAVLAVAWWRWRGGRGRGFFFLCAAFAALSVPCLGFVERPMWPVDRYSYLVHVVLVAGVAIWVAEKIVSRGRRLAWGVAGAGALAIAVAGVAAARQTEIWRDSSELFAHMERHRGFTDDPLQAAHIYVMWAVHERRLGNPGRSAEIFGRAHALYLATMRAAVAAGRYERALEVSEYMGDHFERTANLRRERGGWLLRVGREREAAAELRLADAQQPGDARTQELLAEAEEKAKRR